MSVFAEGEEVVTIRLLLSKFEGLLKAGLIKDMNYEVLKYAIVGERYDNKEYQEKLRQYIKISLELEEITFRLRNEQQNNTSSNTD